MKRLALAVGLLSLAVPLAGHAERPIGGTTVFAHVPAPGAPEGIYVAEGVVYVGTHATVAGNAGQGPSKIFKYDLATGAAVGEIVVEDQNPAETHGLLGMARDAAGRLYVLDRNVPARVIRIDLVTGAQETYATIPDLHSCSSTPAPCSPTVLDEPTFPDYPVFDDAGNLYLTDLQAATIFRVTPGGGTADVWFQDLRLDGVFGPNGMAIDAAGATLYLAMTVSQIASSPGQGLIYTLPIAEAPAAGDLNLFHTFLEPAAGPDGIAFGTSGNLYVALAGLNQMAIVAPNSAEAARFPSAVDNAIAPVPYDLPASIAFNGSGSILLTNQSFFVGNADHMVVFDVWVDDTALPLREPAIP